MTVACMATGCPYNDMQGFCAKPVMICVDEMGMCKTVWKKGQQRSLKQPFNDSTIYRKVLMNIEDAEFEVYDGQQSKKGENTETGEEDLSNGDPHE